eukprot:gene34085-42032_t
MSTLSPKELLLQEAAAAPPQPPAQRTRGISFFGAFSGSTPTPPKPAVPTDSLSQKSDDDDSGSEKEDDEDEEVEEESDDEKDTKVRTSDEAEGKQGWLHRELEMKGVTATTNKDNNLAKEWRDAFAETITLLQIQLTAALTLKQQQSAQAQQSQSVSSQSGKGAGEVFADRDRRYNLHDQ